MNSGRGAGMPRRLAVTGVLAILAALVPTTALAGPPEKGTLSKVAPAGNQSSWQVRAAKGTSAPATSATVAAYPADCIGVSDYPHLSEHNPGYVSAQVRTECRVQRAWMYAYGEMYRDRWYGRSCWTLPRAPQNGPTARFVPFPRGGATGLDGTPTGCTAITRLTIGTSTPPAATRCGASSEIA